MIVLEDYQNIREERPDASQAAAAVKALSNSISLDSSTTMTELLESLEASIEILRASSKNPIAIQAGCDHFIRFVFFLLHTPDLPLPSKSMISTCFVLN